MWFTLYKFVFIYIMTIHSENRSEALQFCSTNIRQYSSRVNVKMQNFVSDIECVKFHSTVFSLRILNTT